MGNNGSDIFGGGGQKGIMHGVAPHCIDELVKIRSGLIDSRLNFFRLTWGFASRKGLSLAMPTL